MPDEPGTQTTTQTAAAATPEGQPKLPDVIVQKGDQFFFRGTADGQEVLVPVTEAAIRLQKDVTADKRLEDIATQRAALAKAAKENETAIAYYQASKAAMFQNDADAGRRALQLIGFEDTDLDEPNSGVAPTATTTVATQKDPRADAFFKTAEELGVDPSEVLANFRAQEAEKIRNRVYGELDQAAMLDKDLSGILASKTPASEEVRNMLRTLVGQKIGSEQLPANAATYAAVTQEVKRKLQVFGLIGQETAGSRSPSPFPGMGPSQGGMGIVNNLRPKERPAPVRKSEVGQEAYLKNLQERWAFDMFQGS